ncbi:MAG: hypothetical protein EOO40_02615 [Deltaproteobacteria bacterium]|nr:MAG: hypothetical protein EOO40_02615 [Deltaproteobacteria bacterium]
MRHRRWASGAKFAKHVVDKLRAEAPKGDALQKYTERQAEIYAVSPKTIRRILAWQTWHAVEGKYLPAHETKNCEVCGDAFGRAFPNGRRRSDTFWRQKRTCGNSCNVKLAWREGRYDDRRLPALGSHHSLWARFWRWLGF